MFRNQRILLDGDSQTARGPWGMGKLWWTASPSGCVGAGAAAGVSGLAELAPMTDDGAFTFVFTLPESAAAGEGGVIAVPYGVDWCDDTGVNNRAAPGGLGLDRVSCALPLVPFTVLAGPGTMVN